MSTDTRQLQQGTQRCRVTLRYRQHTAHRYTTASLLLLAFPAIKTVNQSRVRHVVGVYCSRTPDKVAAWRPGAAQYRQPCKRSSVVTEVTLCSRLKCTTFMEPQPTVSKRARSVLRCRWVPAPRWKSDIKFDSFEHRRNMHLIRTSASFVTDRQPIRDSDAALYKVTIRRGGACYN